MEQIAKKSSELLDGSKKLLAGYKDIESGLGTLKDSSNQIAQGLAATAPYFSNLEKDYTNIEQNQNYQAIKMTVQQSQNGMEQLSAGFACPNLLYYHGYI